MSEMKNTLGTPAITQEAKKFDTVRTLQEGIKLAAILDEQIKEAEKIRDNTPQMSPQEIPVVTVEDIKEEKQAEERPFIQDNER